jgi:hypothetical protein
MKFRHLAFFTGFILSSFFIGKVSADDFKVNEYIIGLDVKPDATEVSIKLELLNSHVDLVGGYQLNLPFKELDQIKVSKDSNQIEFTSKTIDDSTQVDMDFNNDVILPDQTATIEVSFNVKDLLKSEYNIKYIYFPKSKHNFDLEKVNFQISYDESFGEPTFLSSNNIKEGSPGFIDAYTPGALLAVWGDSPIYDISSSYDVVNPNNYSIETLLNLISHDMQRVEYKSVSEMSLGLFNDNTNWGMLRLKNNSSSPVNIQARIVFDESQKKKSQPKKYDWELNLNNTFAKKLVDELDKTSDNLEKIKRINQYLVSNLNPYANEKTDIKRINNLWVRLESDSAFNSFEYCYLAIAAAERSGMQGRIAYGYLTVADIFTDKLKRTPHVWCEILHNNSYIMMDPFLEDLAKLSLFGSQPLDRIRFGTWHPSQQYNNILGLLSTTKDVQNITLTKYENIPYSKTVEIFQEFPSQVVSGDYYSGTVSVKNNTSRFLELKNLYFNAESVIANVNYTDLKVAIVPKNNNIFKVSNLREPNILFTGVKDLNIKLEFENESFDQIVSDFKIEFKTDGSKILNLVFILIITAAVIVFIIMIIKTLHRRSLSNRTI